MPQRPPHFIYAMLIALAALIVATAALMVARKSVQIALSTIEVSDGESITLPVLDEERGQYGFLILAELQISNTGGPAVTLEQLRQFDSGMGFLVALKGEEIKSVNLQPRLFLLDQPLARYGENPRLLREKWNSPIENANLHLALPPGAGKKIGYGVLLSPYDAANARLAEMVLLSLQLTFDNGKIHLLRRGYPVPALEL